jgi:4-hydroxy-2-oxoheptanedioate aldolase
MRRETLRDAVQSSRPLLGAWQQMACPLSTEALGTVGFDWAGFDMQHGLIGYEDLIRGLQALAISGTPSVVRVSGNHASEIGRVLDAGAEGVIVPLVETAGQAAAAAAACRYAPGGGRSWGATRTLLGVTPYSTSIGDVRAVCLVMVETVRGVDNIDEIAAVPGVDGIFVGPSDLAITAGLPPSLDAALDDAEHRALMQRIVDGAARHDLLLGTVLPRPERAGEFFEFGLRMLGVHRDLQSIIDSSRAALNVARERTGVTTSG